MLEIKGLKLEIYVVVVFARTVFLTSYVANEVLDFTKVHHRLRFAVYVWAFLHCK